MKYQIVAIGQLKRGFIRSGCQHFLERLEKYAKVEVVELKEGKARSAEEVKVQEGEGLLRAGGGYLIALDERGKEKRSTELAERITSLENQSIGQVSLLIGGAEGLSEEVKQRVDESWSLSKLTLPHELARLILLEQLYRLETIRAGHPYHRA